jgi:hypothetical protein
VAEGLLFWIIGVLPAADLFVVLLDAAFGFSLSFVYIFSAYFLAFITSETSFFISFFISFFSSGIF